jgi:hypothetical protein
MAFPTTGVIDSFNRADEDPLSDGGKWSIGPDDFGGTNNLRVASNECLQGSATSSNGYRNDQDYGPDCEVYCTLATTLPTTALLLYARCVNIGSGTTDGYAVYFNFSGTDDALICRMDNDSLVGLGSSIVPPAPYALGDKLGLECIGSTIAAYVFQSGAWSQLGTRTDSTYSAAGKIGVRIADSGSNGRIDDFGGGTVAAAGASAPARRRDRLMGALLDL